MNGVQTGDSLPLHFCCSGICAGLHPNRLKKQVMVKFDSKRILGEGTSYEIGIYFGYSRQCYRA